MSIEEIICINFIFAAIFIAMYKLEKIQNKKNKATDKALLELYDRITELENKINSK